MTRPRFDFDDDDAANSPSVVPGTATRAARRVPIERDSRRSHESGPPVSTLAVGMAVLLSSLVMLFVGFVGAYVVFKFSAPEWPPAGTPSMPPALLGSTAILVACSVAIHAALLSIRRGERAKLVRRLSLSTVLGLAFLALQSWTWSDLVSRGMTLRSGLYAAMFYVLTVLHAAHVVGGIAILVSVLVRARHGRYTRESHGGVGACAAYWHFLGGIWAVLFLLLFVFP